MESLESFREPIEKESATETPENMTRRSFLRLGLICGSAALIPKEAKALEAILGAPETSEVTRDALAQLESNPYLAQEETPENIEIIKAVVRNFDPERVDRAIARFSGISRKKIAGERVKSLRFITRHEFADFTKQSGIAAAEFIATAQNDEMFVAVPFVRRNKGGVIDQRLLLDALVHENNHIKTTYSGKTGMGGEQVRHWVKEDASPEFYEGVTELMAQRITEEIDGQPSDQLYGGGEFLAAWLMEQTVGTKILARGYFDDDFASIRKEFDKKMGPGAADNIFHNRFSILAKAFSGAPFPEGVVAAHEFFKVCSKKNPELARELPSRAQKDGLREVFSYNAKTNTLFHFKEVDERPQVSNLVVEDAAPVTTHSFPLRIALVNYEFKGTNTLKDMDAIAQNIRTATNKVEDIHDQIAKELDVKDVSESEEGRRAFLLSIPEYMDATNVVINVADELREYDAAYQNAKTPLERRAVRDAIRARMTQIGNEVIDSIRRKIDATPL